MRVTYLAKKRIIPRLHLVFGCILCVCLIFIPLFSVWGQSNTKQTIDSLRQQQQQVKQQRVNVVKERDRLTNLQTEAEKRLGGLEQNLETTNSQITDSEMRLQQATERLEQLESDLVQAEESYQALQAATIARLRFIQRTPASQGWAVLLQSKNISDFLNRRRNLKLVYQADKEILEKLTDEAKKINDQKIFVEQQKNEIALIRHQLLAQKADYQTQAQSQQELIQRLNNDRYALSAAQAQLEQDSQAIGNLIQQKIAAAERAKAASRRSFISGTGIFAIPSDGPTSSGFGWRTHPILGYRRFHSGLDFAAAYGTPIRAADSGQVIFAGWYGGYGRTVIIDHGKGTTTLYAHSSELMVSEGQSVKRGQQIATIGSTGLSTGPHLHFEVRRNGTPVDPGAFL